MRKGKRTKGITVAKEPGEVQQYTLHKYGLQKAAFFCQIVTGYNVLKA
jgi:hypothetical protein